MALQKATSTPHRTPCIKSQFPKASCCRPGLSASAGRVYLDTCDRAYLRYLLGDAASQGARARSNHCVHPEPARTMAPWEPFYAPELLRRPNTGSMWSNPEDYSLLHNIDGVARPRVNSDTSRPGLWDEVQRSPQRCSQAFRSSQKRITGLQTFKARDPRQISADMFDADFLPQSAAPMGMSVKEPARPNMVFESRCGRVVRIPRQDQPRRIHHPPSARDHPALPTRPSTVDPANDAAASPRSAAERKRVPRTNDRKQTHQRFLSPRQPFADAGQVFESHSPYVERQLCNMCTQPRTATPSRTPVFHVDSPHASKSRSGYFAAEEQGGGMTRQQHSHPATAHTVGRYSSNSGGTPRFFAQPVAGGLREQLRVSPLPTSPQCNPHLQSPRLVSRARPHAPPCAARCPIQPTPRP